MVYLLETWSKLLSQYLVILDELFKMEKLKKVKNDLSKQKNYHENKLICSKYFATNVIKGTLDQAQDFELALEYG